MKKLFLLIVPIMLGLTACNNNLTAEQAEAAVIQGEKDRLPILLQSLTLVDDITIDIIRLTITEEPMQGYLYTTWKRGKKERPIIVQVDSIHSSKEHKGYIEWQSDWERAAKAYFMKSFGF